MADHLNIHVVNRFQSDLNIDNAAYTMLMRLVNRAADEQVKYHNGEKNIADLSMELVEDWAKAHKLKLEWPGVYPVIIKDGHWHYLPE